MLKFENFNILGGSKKDVNQIVLEITVISNTICNKDTNSFPS
jgi:hypothetical protein